MSASSIPTVSRPSRVLKAVFKAPVVLYRVGLGWMLGRRFLALTHRGRKTGRIRETVLEVILFDPDTRESVVVSAFGTKADWYRNVLVRPALRVRTGRTSYVPNQRFLTNEERREVALEFAGRHPWETRLVPKMLLAIGAAVSGNPDEDPVDTLTSLPMVGFRPTA